MIIQPESQISLFHSLVRIMYIMLNYVWKVLVLIRYNNINVLYRSLALSALLSGNMTDVQYPSVRGYCTN